MTGAEGQTIAAVWREDLLRPRRILMIARMPAKLYEAMFPLTIEPAPKEVVRVGLVFDALEGQLEASAWIPELRELEKELQKAANGLGSGEWREREEASRVLVNAGPRARNILEELARSQDPEVRARAEELLKKMIVPEVEAPAREGTVRPGVTITAVK